MAVNETFLLEGFLYPYQNGVSYIRKYPESGVLVGLGWFPESSHGISKAAWCPPRDSRHLDAVFRNSLENAVTDAYLTLRSREGWQEQLVGLLGWFTDISDTGFMRASKFKSYDTDDMYTLVERAWLNDFPDTANPSKWLSAIRRVSGKPGQDLKTVWVKALKAAQLGVSPEEFVEFVNQLPEETINSLWG